MAEFTSSKQIAGTSVSIATSSTQLMAANATRRRAVLHNTDASNPVYLGNATVATTSGFRVAAGESVVVMTRSPLFAISTGGSVDVDVLEEFD